jgi:uncharacterized protein YjbJ (UPF0337 family)
MKMADKITNTPLWDQIAGSWKEVRGQVRTQWGKLTDDDLEMAKGQRDVLAGRIQQRYGIAREEANRQIDEWADKLKF